MALALQLTRLASSRSPSLFKLANSSLANRALFTTTANNNVVLKPIKFENYEGVNHDLKNRTLKRQLSPCLSIYDIQLTTVLSISHRATGMALTGLGLTICGATILPPHDISSWISAIEALNLYTPILLNLKFSLAFITTFHTFNGIRHLLWDNAKFLELHNVYKTGYIVVGVSTITAAILALL